MEWDVLEGNVIAAFQALFWHTLGKRGLPPFELIGVELLQQTQLDTVLGDLLIANARFVRLIEFKRELNKDPKEHVKFERLKAAIDDRGSYALLQSISREMHWFVLSNFNKHQATVVVPYLDLEAPVGDRDLIRFVEETVDALAGPRMNEDDLREYIQVLGRCSSSGRIPRTTGGLLFTVNLQGKSIIVPIRDVQELAMAPRLILEQRRMALERELKQQLTPERELKQRLTRGMSR